MVQFRLSRALPALLFFALAPIGAAHAETRATASYVINLGGTIIASAKFNFTKSAGNYQLKLDANVTGIAQLVASSIARAQFRGQRGGRRPPFQQF